ncbi:MAG TPA: hypothetical protein VG318_16590 [Actinomycetota bacterium]|nr:hypothetical protein [Actinomycetota bacterium]
MKRLGALAVAAVVAATTIGAAVPAQADTAQPIPCPEAIQDSPTAGSVYIDDQGKLQIQPDAVGTDVEAFSAWAADTAVSWTLCMVSRLPLDAVWCSAGLGLDVVGSIDPAALHLRYVYPNGSGWTVDIPALSADARTLVDCTGISVN